MTSTASATSVLPVRDLTEANIKTAEAGETLRDADISGLHLRAFATKKVFYLYFRTKAGQQRRPKLGNHGQITLTQARKIANHMLARVALGEDPIATQAGARGEHTVEDLWKEYWRRNGSKRKTAGEKERTWLQDLKPALASAKLSAVTFTQAADLHEKIGKRAPIQANRAMALLSKMYSFAHRPLQWHAGANPCRGIERNKEKKRRRKASREELARLMTRLRRELDGENCASAAFVWLLLLTGARKGEIAATRPDNLHGNRILLDEHKTDDGGHARVIYVPRAGLDIVEKYLAPHTTRQSLTGIKSPIKFWERIRKEEGLVQGDEYLNLHDLRRTFASVALSSGAPLEQVMQLLGHASAQTSKIYAHLMEDVATDRINSVAQALQPDDIFS